MECASRALAFWAYQSTQEVLYQEYLGKSLTDKYTKLNVHLDKVVHNANSEISALHSKVAEMQTAQEQLQSKNQELADLNREKSKKLSQMTNLYNLLKARAMRSRMEIAASDDVTQALRTLNTTTSKESTESIRLPNAPMRGPQQQSIPVKIPVKIPVNSEGVEQLHRYQRSATGSSRHVSKTPTTLSRGAAPRYSLPSLQKAAPPARQQHRTRLSNTGRVGTAISGLPPHDEIVARFGN
ncbi:cyclin [Penicillium chermesinum]|uniref:Cyclin n=1 Tax=Penicillium chermesinum TaxID=63820 RepID=A0A9W9P758_9EURO|nr:cyclin [Penicillium chermesinum]KAJ5239087.1 cyclin [Penicillium chermesinum]KAJ6164727.1 cyclin [Penicillium chermesinum]